MTLEEIILAALDEDLPDRRDITGEIFVPESLEACGYIEVREQAIVSGLEVAVAAFRALDTKLEYCSLVVDGTSVSRLTRVLEVRGAARSILAAERTALNFLGHLSGIASLTRAFVEKTRPYGTQVLGTRKTLPGLRALEIQAIRHGGGQVYRTDLRSAVLVKDNHVTINGGASGIVRRLSEWAQRDKASKEVAMRHWKIEVGNLDELRAAAMSGWNHVLLDNFSPADVVTAVDRFGGTVTLEVSGGVTLENVESYARTGVPLISIGALTHSARAIDFSLEMDWGEK